MKKRYLAMLMAAMIGCSGVMTGCSIGNIGFGAGSNDEIDDDDIDEDGKDNDGEDPSVVGIEVLDGDGEYLAVAPSIDEQINTILTCGNQWIPKNEQYLYTYAVTDLDYDGFLDVLVVCTQQVMALDVDIKAYEVSEDGSSLEEMAIDFNENGSMPGLGNAEYHLCAVVDIDGLGTLKPYAYIVEDYSMYSYTNTAFRKFAIVADDNGISIEKLGYGSDFVNSDGDEDMCCYDVNGNQISYMAYENCEIDYLDSKLSNYDMKIQAFKYMSMSAEITQASLADSYEGFVLYDNAQDFYDDRYGVDQYGPVADDYPEGWVPENYSYENWYSAVGDFRSRDIDEEYITCSSWSAFEVHDENGIYCYDYRDCYDRMYDCFIEFDNSGSGYYSDGCGAIQNFTYEVYTIYEFGTHGVNIQLDNGDLAYVFAYELTDEYGVKHECIMVNFVDEAVYFWRSVG